MEVIKENESTITSKDIETKKEIDSNITNGKETNNIFRQINKYDSDLYIHDPKFISKLRSSAQDIYCRLKMLVFVSKLVKNNYFGLTDWPPLKRKEDFPSWWGEKEDKDLLQGIFIHGYGRYNIILNDQDLSFKGRATINGKRKKKEN